MDYSLVIAILALTVSIISIYYSRKNVKSQLFLSLVEKESHYMTEWNNDPKSDDKVWQYVNFLETVSLLYNKREVDKGLICQQFKSVFRDIYSEYKSEIDSKIAKGDLAELNDLLKEWKVK